MPLTFFNFSFFFLLQVLVARFVSAFCLCDGSHGYVKNNFYTWARHLDISVKTAKDAAVRTCTPRLANGPDYYDLEELRGFDGKTHINLNTKKRHKFHIVGLYDFAIIQ